MMTRPININVTHSLRGFSWRERLNEEQKRHAEGLAQSHNISSLLACTIIGRDIIPEKVTAYLEPRLAEHLPDPSTLKDAEKAASLINQAIDNHQSIAVFADYDVDGAAAAALISDYVRAFGQETSVHIPDRIIEGYGPNETAIKQLHEAGADVLICVDCGANSEGPLTVAKSLGLTVIVIDHHIMTDEGPQIDALVNPNQPSDSSALCHLAAAGVVFMVLVAANRNRRQTSQPKADLPDLLNALDLVALATVCDVVPLIGLNRAFVTQGLAIMKRSNRPGLSALMQVSKLEQPVRSYHLGFVLGPRINAGGRIGESSLGYKLLTSPSQHETLDMAQKLDNLNRERQHIEKLALDDAFVMAEKILLEAPDTSILLLDNADWHVGIIGLIAARIRERFHLPAIIISWEDDIQGKGSGRSVEGLDIGALIIKAVGKNLIAKGGGHAMAAGLSLKKSQLSAFNNFLQSEAAQAVTKAKSEKIKLFDAEASASGLSLETAYELTRAAPYGRDNPEPCLALFEQKILFAKPVGSNHLKLKLGDQHGGTLDAIAFRAMDSDFGPALIKQHGQSVHVLGTLNINHWQGREKPALTVIDAAIEPVQKK